MRPGDRGHAQTLQTSSLKRKRRSAPHSEFHHASIAAKRLKIWSARGNRRFHFSHTTFEQPLYCVVSIALNHAFRRITIITSPLYHKLAGGSATQIDEFNTTRLGGYSLVPVNSSSNPKARTSRNKAGVVNQYIDYTLTTGSQWQTNSVNTTVPILIGEGVWVENRFGSSQTWTVSLPIW
jgi:hypothetical protein